MALRLQDRCTRCDAQAYILAMKGDLDLLFCGHHGRMYLDALILQGWEIHDETAMVSPADAAPEPAV